MKFKAIDWTFNRVMMIAATQFLLSCAHPSSHAVNSDPNRDPASDPAVLPVAIHYVSYATPDAAEPSHDVVTPERWKGVGHGFSAGGRADYLVKFWSAANRNFSNSHKRHAVCFTGTAHEIQKEFFDESDRNNAIANSVGSPVPKTRASDDEQQINVLFVTKAPGSRSAQSRYFRMSACSAGKMPIMNVSMHSDSRDPSSAAGDGDAPAASTDTRTIPAKAAASVTTAQEDGFSILDVVSAKDSKSTKFKKLPRFTLQAKYSKIGKLSIDRPWQGLDVTQEQGAAELAAMLQMYFYNGMATQDPTTVDRNFIAKDDGHWCHMPWLNVGDSGREAIHGLTKERNLFPSPMEGFTTVASGTDWGVGYYNEPGCSKIGEIFGDASNPKAAASVPAGVQFPEGTISAKILFTTSPTFATTNAYTWLANVSGVNSNERSIQPVKHIQMDISIRDGSIKGARAANHNWIMLTYYYDAAFDYDRDFVKKYNLTGRPWLAGLASLPDGLKHMRPMGVQPGFGPPGPAGDSLVFTGAKTNGAQSRLNGPADNPKSSCLGCHGTAGTTVAMSPGFMSDADFAARSANNIDFSQQLALAKRNMHPPGQP